MYLWRNCILTWAAGTGGPDIPILGSLRMITVGGTCWGRATPTWVFSSIPEFTPLVAHIAPVAFSAPETVTAETVSSWLESPSPPGIAVPIMRTLNISWKKAEKEMTIRIWLANSHWNHSASKINLKPMKWKANTCLVSWFFSPQWMLAAHRNSWAMPDELKFRTMM